MGTLTPTLQLSKPTVNDQATNNLWGYDLNSNFDKIDTWVGPLPSRITALEQGGVGSGGSTDWNDITGKPGTFPPSAHTHTAANVTDFQEAVEDLIGASVIAGTNVTVTYNDTTGKTTVAATGGGGAGVTDGDKGDIVVSDTGATWMFDSAVVTGAAKTVLDDTTVGAMLTTLGAAPVSHTHTVSQITDIATTYAPLASPTFTGTPTAPTPTAGDNDTSIATTAFVMTGLATKAPLATISTSDPSGGADGDVWYKVT